ncbi:MAG: ROK family transcriptional regulator, partial [Solirubrobacterales bacterium]
MTAGPSPLSVRQLNRLRVIETVYRHPATSRAELTRHTGLARQTVSTVIDELLGAGIVQEHGAPEDDRPRNTGRPPILLSLVSDAAFAVGLDFGHQHIRVAVCDLSGQPIVDDFSPAEVDYAPTQSFDLAEALVREALNTAGIERDRLLGVGMDLAAPINRTTGELETNGILPGWHGIRPGAEMEARLGIPVQIENDANAGALGEKLFGAGRGVDDLVYVRLSAGIGAGIILAGRPYHGSLGVAGEIGHVLSDPQGPICRCGNRGGLETIASPVAVAALLERSKNQPVSIPVLLELVAAAHRGARRAVGDAGDAIGAVLAVLVNILNPQLLLFGGELAAAGEVILEPIREAIARSCVTPASTSVRVAAGTLGPRAEVLGAAALILAQSPHTLAQRVKH